MRNKWSDGVFLKIISKLSGVSKKSQKIHKQDV